MPEIPYPPVFHDWQHDERRVATATSNAGVRVEITTGVDPAVWTGVELTEGNAALLAGSLLVRAADVDEALRPLAEYVVLALAEDREKIEGNVAARIEWHGSAEKALTAALTDIAMYRRRAFAAEAALAKIRGDVHEAMETWQREGSGG